MKHLPTFLLFGLAAFCCVFAVTSCGLFGQAEYDAFSDAYDAAMADKVIDTQEAALLKELGQKWLENAGQVDWATELGKLAGTVLASVFGVNLWRNHNLPGSTRTEPQP